MIFEQIATGGCQLYLVGCPDTLGAVPIDPEISQIDRYRALANRDGLRVRYIVDTHNGLPPAERLAAELHGIDPGAVGSRQAPDESRRSAASINVSPGGDRLVRLGGGARRTQAHPRTQGPARLAAYQ